MPPWKAADFHFAGLAIDKNNINSADVTQKDNNWKCSLLLTDNSAIDFYINVVLEPASKTVSITDVQEMFNNKDFVALVFKNYLNKIIKAKSIVQAAVKKLNEHRNLCEDFVSVTTIDDELISFCFDVDVKPSADIEKIEAEVFYAIENYLNPPIEFYTLSELLDKKIPVDEIFEGTILQHGFIDTGQLESTQLKTVIYTSDIINLLMDIDGVLAVRNFMMTKYGDDGNPVTGFIGLKWCMNISYLHKPVLFYQKSKILFFKNQFPFLANYEEVHDTILLLHAQRERRKLNGLEDDIPVPAGNKRDSESYWPVQYDFPQTYGIGEAGLPSDASQTRISQQRQLKAYLMFYEQLLADFLSQLTHARELFSIGNQVQTYFAQFLEKIKDIDPVYNTNNPPGYLKDILAVQNSVEQIGKNWQKVYEPTDLFYDRRNRFLDHLLARFAESFNDYALLMYQINYEDKSEEKIKIKDLTDSKIFALGKICEISSERAKAFNYFPQNDDFTLDTTKLWDTDNVSGLEERICLLTGIENFKRRFLYCIKNIEIICNEETVEENGSEIVKCFHTFSVTSLEDVIMVSEKYDKKEDAEKAVTETIEFGAEKDHYKFDQADSKLKIFNDSNEILLESSVNYADKDSAMHAADKLAAEFSKECSDPVGLHLIEHILLRKRAGDFSILNDCLHDCDCICELDPYSFRVSVVLPYWPSYFDSLVFRTYFEDKIREEAPAHIALKICWLNNNLMRKFEICYKKWIEALANYSLDKINNLISFKDANDAMIDILGQLHSEYPQATLHDCKESKEGSNTVVLGKTVLGTFKN